jgi:hypothetical protein
MGVLAAILIDRDHDAGRTAARGPASPHLRRALLAVRSRLCGEAAPLPTGALVLVGVCSLVAWLAALRRCRLVADTPTSLLASAAQGYVELVGRCELHPGSPALGYLSGPPCVWYRCAVSRRTSEGWSSTSCERSTDTFLLRDASGTSVVDPDHAEVTGARKRSWTQGEYRYDFEHLAPGDLPVCPGRSGDTWGDARAFR